METLFQPADPKHAEVDIVLIDGFFSRNEGWPEPWIQGLLKEMPRGRILKFEYRQDSMQSRSSQMTYDETEKYARELDAILEDGTPEKRAVPRRRPILFITRGLSALVCIQVALGNLSPETIDNQSSTRARGILMLEAPFCGSFTTEPVGRNNQKLTVFADPISVHKLKEGEDGFWRAIAALRSMMSYAEVNVDREQKTPSIQNFENRIVNQAQMITVHGEQSIHL